MEFTSSFDMALKDKLYLPTSNWDGSTTSLDSLDGGNVQAHIVSMINAMWDFSTVSDLPLLTRECYYDVTIMMFANVLEDTSKTVVLMDPANNRFFISFSSTRPFSKEEVLAHFNLTLNNELDNYKHTNSILNDVQRHTLNSKPNL